MAITVTHPTAAIEPGDGDPNKIQPEDWNMNHTVVGTVDIANGGTGANSEAGARTNLGLGTIATQNSNNVSITGGSIAGVTIAGLDANTTFQDNVDPTKQMRFELSGVSAGQTRILTVPDFDGTVATLAGAESLTNKTLVDTTNLEVTNLKAKDGTAAGTIADTTGVVTLASSVLTTADINGGTIDGTTQASGTINGPIAAGGTWTAAATWTLPAVTLGGTVTSNGQSFSGTIANLGTVTTADINGGTIDGTTIGGDSAAAGTFTTLTSTGNATLGDDPATDTHTINGGLTIKNTGAGNTLLIEDSASTDSTPFVIDSAGRVIIGHTTAVDTSAGIQTVGTSGVANHTAIRYADSVAGPLILLQKGRGTTLGGNTVVAVNDQIGGAIYYGNDGSGFIQGASIFAYVDGTPGTNDMPGRLVFSTTADGASSPTERYRIASDGKHTYAGYAALTNSTNNAAFTITNTGTGNSFVVEDSASTDATPFVIDASGNVVHGTTSVLANMQWFGTTYVTPSIQAASTGAGHYALGAYVNSASSASTLYLYKSRGATPGTNTVLVSGDLISDIAFSGNDGTNFIRSAQISAYVDGTPGTNDMPGRLIFATTADGASSPTEALRINSSQSVIPAKLLDLSTSTAGQIKFPASQNASSDANTLDDYEEGTFTPVVRDAAAGNAATAAQSKGFYTKVGNVVNFEIYFSNIDTTGLTAGNQVYITGLPFTSVNTSWRISAQKVYVSSCTPTTGSVTSSINSNVSYAVLYNDATTGISNFTVSQITSGTGDIGIAGHYTAA